MSWRWDNSYLSLPPGFWEKAVPAEVPTPRLLVVNEVLMKELGLQAMLQDPDSLARQLVGNEIPEGAAMIAQAYAGHQFGHFTRLGDGRAILIGEHLTAGGERFDIQLKGAGRTRYSRRGDGKATLASMLREYLMSESMHALGIASTRSLAVVATGQMVQRPIVQPGAVLTRVAASHLRVGTFEYAKHFGEEGDLQALLRYTIQRHYPDLASSEQPALDLLRAVMNSQIALVVDWLRVGFIHGVMNTDNVSIAAETIDYGPCAFMNAYRPGTVFSSIDQGGRYAFNQQAGIMQWNMAVLAGALLPLVSGDEDFRLAQVRSILNEYGDLFMQQWESMLCRKIGLPQATPEDRQLARSLLKIMSDQEADYTNVFLGLRRAVESGLADWVETSRQGAGSTTISGEHPQTRKQPLEANGLSGKEVAERVFGFFQKSKNNLLTDFFQAPILEDWLSEWGRRFLAQDTPRSGLAAMQSANPVRIPRNHLVEDVLDAATAGDMQPFNDLLADLLHPYDDLDGSSYQSVPEGYDQRYKTYCGT